MARLNHPADTPVILERSEGSVPRSSVVSPTESLDSVPVDAATAIAALAERYQQGDAEALALLHDRLRPAIGGVLARYRRLDLPSSISAQDLSQQTWVILADLARRWQPSGSFLAYFLRSFSREIQRYFGRALPSRRTRSVQMITLPHDDLLMAVDRHLHAADPIEDLGPLLASLKALPPEQRVALALRAVEGYDFAAIGKTLGVSRATAHRLCQRAIAALRGRVNYREGDPAAFGPVDGGDDGVLPRAE